jgi:hypothetical protein
MDDKNRKPQTDVYSKAVRAGKRTYFFDVKATRDTNLYLTITESKRKPRDDGSFFYEKHKVFLYKEDFLKFSDGLQEVLDYIRENNPTPVVEQTYQSHDAADTVEASNDRQAGSSGKESFTDVDFDELGNP